MANPCNTGLQFQHRCKYKNNAKAAKISSHFYGEFAFWLQILPKIYFTSLTFAFHEVVLYILIFKIINLCFSAVKTEETQVKSGDGVKEAKFQAVRDREGVLLLQTEESYV